jgi:hypothetical protein
MTATNERTLSTLEAQLFTLLDRIEIRTNEQDITELTKQRFELAEMSGLKVVFTGVAASQGEH